MHLKKLITFVLFAVLVMQTGAQQLQPIPMDPKIRYGKLDNGLTYYIRANNEPKNRAEFYIAQNVGAILENDDQNGLAHFLEHMAFNGTKNFPGKGIINYLETVGVKFGADINAHTGLDETVYNLSDVPTNRIGTVDSALLVLHDWSNFISLDGNEIDAERGVIREEWRQGAGPERRMWKESNKIKYAGSQYAKRDVIGDTAIINNFKHKTIRDFYKKWYRPDLQAILIVGDVNVDSVEATIKSLFADIPKPVNPAERIIYPIPDNKEPIIAVVKDKEASMTRIELEYKHKRLPDEVKLSIQGYMFSTINALISKMIGYRFDEITQQADAPFVGGYAYYGELVKSTDAFDMLVVPKEGQELKGLDAVLLEAQKIKRFGFTNSELERAKADYMKMIEKDYNERGNQKSHNLVEEYVRNFLNQEPIPGIEWEYNTLKMVLPQLKVNMINQIAKSYVTDTNMIVSIMASDKEAVKIPSDSQIMTAIEQAKTAQLTPPVEESLNKPLVKDVPVMGRVKKYSENKVLGTTEWILSNGVKVILKPTTFKKDEILLTSFSEGGLSQVKNVSDLPSATMATAIVSNNGLGEFNQIDLDKILTGKIASVSPYIDRYTEGFNGNSSVSDFTTMLQLIYLNFTGVRKDDNAFAALINGYKASLANSASDPRKAFSDSVNVMLTNHNPRTVIFNTETLDKVNQDKALAIFRERFSNPADFTFIFTGNVDPNNKEMKDAICTYLGGMKAAQAIEKYTDNGIRYPKGKVSDYFEKQMKVNKASNFILYSGVLPFDMTNRTVMTAIGNILSIRYVESIREKEGATYGVGVRGSLIKTPINEALLMMQFDTDPARQTKMIGLIHEEVQKIAKEGPLPADVQKVKENMLKEYSEKLAENSWWSAALNLYYQDKLNMLTDYKPVVEALSPKIIESVLNKVVSQGNVMEVVMKPVQ